MLKKIKKKQIKKCVDCNIRIAEFYAKYLKKYHGDYGKGDYYCTECLIDNLEGIHTGGGPTAAIFESIKRIKKSPKIKSEKFSPWQKLKKLREIICFSSLDFSTSKTLACIYGIVVGYDKHCLDELLEKKILDQDSYDGIIKNIGVEPTEEGFYD